LIINAYIVGFLCLFSIIFIVAWSLYPFNQSFSLRAFEPAYWYDDQSLSGNVDTSKYRDGNFTNFEELPIDLWAGTYQSDGENLNVTLWLANIIDSENHADYVSMGLKYELDIYSVNPINGTSAIKLYSIIGSPEEDGTWVRTIYQWSPPTAEGIQLFKPVKQYYNYGDFFLQGLKYFNIPISLTEIGDPVSFNLDIHTFAVNNTLYDNMPFILSVPPRINDIKIEPLSLTARAGQSSSFDISIHGIELSARSNVSLHDANEEDDIGLSFEPDILEFDLNETQKTKLELNVPRDVQSGQIVPVDVILNITTIEGETGNISRTFSVEVLPPLSMQEQTLAFLVSIYGFYWIPVVVAGAFGLWFTRGMNQKVIESLQLSHMDILTINASVIVGVLIFLTLGGSALFIQIGILTATIVLPFAISILVTLRYGQVRQGIKLTILGFVYLMVSVILIAFGTGS